jgi:hypothetical protein
MNLKNIRNNEENTVPIYVEEIKIHDWKLNEQNRSQKKILICPKCLHEAYFRFDKNNNNWKIQKFLTKHPLPIKSLSEYDHHVKFCSSPLKFGYNKINKKSDIQCFEIIEILSKWCRRDTHYYLQQVISQDFTSENDEIIAFVKYQGIGPISYVAYRKKPVNIDGKIINYWFMWDLFTFSSFRRKKYALDLVELSLHRLGIDKKLIPISGPVTDLSCKLINKIAEDRILLYMPDGYYIIDKNEINKPPFRFKG